MLQPQIVGEEHYEIAQHVNFVHFRLHFFEMFKKVLIFVNCGKKLLSYGTSWFFFNLFFKTFLLFKKVVHLSDQHCDT